MNAPQYFPFLIDIFSRLINVSWRTEYGIITHQKLPPQQSPEQLLLYLRSLYLLWLIQTLIVSHLTCHLSPPKQLLTIPVTLYAPPLLME